VKLEFNPPGGRYGLCLHELRLLAPGEEVEPLPNPLRSAGNVALEARVEASSTHEDYAAQAVADGRVGGFPGDIDKEWATSGEKAGAWVKLSWDQPRTIRRIQVFDRPNALDQVTGGRLEFSDGSAIDLAQPIPDNALQGLEIAFGPKTVSWVKFTVTTAKSGSPNIGLAEFAVFSDPRALEKE
jgi:hypothetical protein